MRQKKQSYLPGFGKLGTTEFGGSTLKGNPREARPISTKRPLHLVMRSSLAKGERSFLRASHSKRIRELVFRVGKEKGVKVYRFANSGNHLHLLILPSSIQAYRAYVRAVSGLIARIVLGVERGRASGNRRSQVLGAGFWDARPFTRIVEWGRAFQAASRYLLQNTLEALGFVPYQPRTLRKRARAGP